MEQLRLRGLEDILRQKVMQEGVRYIGICIGFQILFEESEEAPGVKGLGWLRGRVVRFRGGLTVPHMGWNEVRPAANDSPVARAFPAPGPAPFFYFVHSFHPVPSDRENVAGWTEYGGEFASAVQSRHIFGVQFHPEKSQEAGRRLLANLLKA